MRDKLSAVVDKAWGSFEAAASLESRVYPALPILFFGDLDAYEKLDENLGRRVLTVGLNPSNKEFHACAPYQRFPLAERFPLDQDQNRYLDALSAYFRTHPYEEWFKHFEPLLEGMDASYCECQSSSALHTDICSPVATDPTWNDLDPDDQDVLMNDGVSLWHDLLSVLRPDIVLLSVAQKHHKHIEFKQLKPEQPVRTFKRSSNGKPRRPYKVCGRWYDVNQNDKKPWLFKPAFFVFCPAGRTPVPIGRDQKKKLGKRIMDRYAKTDRHSFRRNGEIIGSVLAEAAGPSPIAAVSPVVPSR